MKRIASTRVYRQFKQVVACVLIRAEPVIITRGASDLVAVVPASWIKEHWAGFDKDAIQASRDERGGQIGDEESLENA